MTNLDKLLGWRQALIFFIGIILVIAGIGLLLSSIAVLSILGALINICGFILLVINLKATMSNKDLPKGGRLALFIPKVIFSIILLIISISFYFTALM